MLVKSVYIAGGRDDLGCVYLIKLIMQKNKLQNAEYLGLFFFQFFPSLGNNKNVFIVRLVQHILSMNPGTWLSFVPAVVVLEASSSDS